DLEPNNVNIGHAVNFPQENCPPVMSVTAYESVGTFRLDPCYVGVICDATTASLAFNIQPSGYAAISNFAPSVTWMDVYSLFADPPPFGPGEPDMSAGSGWNDLTFFYLGHASRMIDFSDYLNARPEVFYVQTSYQIIPDHSHHLLL